MPHLIARSPLLVVASSWTAGWASASQLQARRNAMAAMTALSARRLERREVEEYLKTAHAVPVQRQEGAG